MLLLAIVYRKFEFLANFSITKRKGESIRWDLKTILEKERCIKQHVQIVVMNVKFLLNQLKADLFTVGIASRNIGSLAVAEEAAVVEEEAEAVLDLDSNHLFLFFLIF